jgi:DNA-binding response OmpR family regulator
VGRILIVDDDPIVRVMVRGFLSREGHVCAEAEEGEMAVRALERDAFDVVLVDLLMPVREGVETIGEIRRRWPDLRIIAMSGGSARLAKAGLLDLASGMGAHDTLAKPVDETLLLLLVERQLRLAAQASPAS